MNKISRQLKKLSFNEKFLIVALFFCFIFTIPNWFFHIKATSIPNEYNNYANTKNFNAYQGIAAVMGYFYSIFILSALFGAISTAFIPAIKRFFEKKYWFYLFLTGEALFILVLTTLIYTSYSMHFTKAGIKYGLILAIISNIIALFAAHFYYLKKNKIKIKKQFSAQMHNNIHLEAEKITPVPQKEHIHKEKHEPKKTQAQMSLGDFV